MRGPGLILCTGVIESGIGDGGKTAGLSTSLKRLRAGHLEYPNMCYVFRGCLRDFGGAFRVLEMGNVCVCLRGPTFRRPYGGPRLGL